MNSWDAPDLPMEPPPLASYAAAHAHPLLPAQEGGATRESATCPACVQLLRKKRQTSLHTLEWGKCMRAMPPPPAVDHSAVPVPLEPFDLDSAPQEDLDPELQPAVLVEEPIASTAKLGVRVENKTMLEHPHAHMAMSDSATWGSVSSNTGFHCGR